MEMEELRSLFMRTPLQKLIRGKENLTEVPYTATISETLQIMHERNIDAVPVSLPLTDSLNHHGYADSMVGQSMLGGVISFRMQEGTVSRIILDEQDSHDRYSGIVTSFDILTYFSKLLVDTTNDVSTTLRRVQDSPIHLCIERKMTFVMSPSISVLEAMERMINGVHIALVPHNINKQNLKLTTYFMITQMDMIQYFKAEEEKFRPILSQTVKASNAMQPELRGVWGETSLLDTIKFMHRASVSVVPIVESRDDDLRQTEQLLDAKGRVIVGTFSASDLKGCLWEPLNRWPTERVLRFLKRVCVMEKKMACSVDTLEANPDVMGEADVLCSFVQFDHVSCRLDYTLGQVIDTALQNNASQVWVVDEDCILLGVVSITDILRVARRSIDA